MATELITKTMVEAWRKEGHRLTLTCMSTFHTPESHPGEKMVIVCPKSEDEAHWYSEEEFTPEAWMLVQVVLHQA